MKIGYILQSGVPELRTPPFSGPAHHVRQVCREWIQLGHQVRVIADLDGQMWKSDDLESFVPVFNPDLDAGLFRTAERGIRRVQSLLQLPYISLFDSLRFAAACRRELAGFDLLFERQGWFGFGGWLAARWLRIPLVLEINGDLVNEMRQLGIAPRGLQRAISTFIVRTGARAAAGCVATGDGWRRRFAEQWGVSSKKITVVENGSEMVNLLTREQLRSFQPSGSGSLPDGTHLAFVGSLDPWQGLPVLIEAFTRAVRKEPGLRLSILGDGAGLASLKQLAQEYHLDSCVAFLGWLPTREAAALLATADIGVSPYCGRVEFSGLKLLDYKAAGLAIIASGQDGQPSVLNHGQTGWIVPPCDVEALSDAILMLSREVGLRKQIGQAARAEAEQSHSWRSTAQNLIREFSRVTA